MAKESREPAKKPQRRLVEKQPEPTNLFWLPKELRPRDRAHLVVGLIVIEWGALDNAITDAIRSTVMARMKRFGTFPQKDVISVRFDDRRNLWRRRFIELLPERTGEIEEVYTHIIGLARSRHDIAHNLTSITEQDGSFIVEGHDYNESYDREWEQARDKVIQQQKKTGRPPSPKRVARIFPSLIRRFSFSEADLLGILGELSHFKDAVIWFRIDAMRSRPIDATPVQPAP
jgi:hypothetical protein